VGRLVGLDGREIVHCEQHFWQPTSVTLTANTPVGPVPAVIVLRAHCRSRDIQLLDIPGLTAMAPPPGAVPVPE
jgi:hypothetical protein